MLFLVDESTGTAVAQSLRNEGHDVKAVADVLPEADDEDVLRFAMAEDRILITNDKDFGELVFRSGQPCPGLILIRPQVEGPANKIRVVTWTLAQCGQQLRGNMIVATETSIRIRPLPKRS